MLVNNTINQKGRAKKMETWIPGYVSGCEDGRSGAFLRDVHTYQTGAP